MADPSAAWQDGTRAVAAGIRRRVFEHVLRNGEGYLSQACSAAEMLAMLYTRTLALAPLEAPIRPGAFRGVPGPRTCWRRLRGHRHASFPGPARPAGRASASCVSPRG